MKGARLWHRAGRSCALQPAFAQRQPGESEEPVAIDSAPAARHFSCCHIEPSDPGGMSIGTNLNLYPMMS